MQSSWVARLEQQIRRMVAGPVNLDQRSQFITDKSSKGGLALVHFH